MSGSRKQLKNLDQSTETITFKDEPNNWPRFQRQRLELYRGAESICTPSVFKKQMDLNWDNPEVRDELAQMVKGWLEKGVDGFRMDVINYISKREGLPDGNEK